MKISIIIPNHNRVDTLGLTLDALEHQTIPPDEYEVILVDQASNDGSYEFAKEWSPSHCFRLIRQDEKYGPSIARNYGAEVANSPLILFLDSDIIADPKMIEAHISLHLKYQDPIIACGRILPYPSAYLTFVEKAANPESGLDRGALPEDFPFYLAFSNQISVSRQSFEDVGSFNPTLRAYEDVEFGYRWVQKGFGIKNCKEAIGYHNHPRSLTERCSQRRTYNRMLPKIQRMYPEIYAQIPDTRPFEPMTLKGDSHQWLLKKILVRFYSLSLVRYLFSTGCHILEKFPISTLAAKFFFYRLILGYGFLGYKEGRKSLEK